MKNVMLGHSGVGKTTFVASTFGQMLTPVNGFTLQAHDPSDAERLNDLHRQVRHGHYPPPTATRGEYDFRLAFHGNPVIDFTWADYRGGALNDASTTTDTAEVLADLTRCDSIMVFLDAQAILRGNRQVGREIRVISNMIGRAVGQIERPVPLSVVFTKTDLIPRGGSRRLREPVASLLETLSAGRWVQGAVFEVACGERPRDVELPLLFALSVAVGQKIGEVQARIAGHEAEARAHRHRATVHRADASHYRWRASRKNLFENIWDFLNEGTTDSWRASEADGSAWYAGYQAEEALKLAQAEYARLEPLKAPSEALVSRLAGVARYGGREALSA